MRMLIRSDYVYALLAVLYNYDHGRNNSDLLILFLVDNELYNCQFDIFGISNLGLSYTRCRHVFLYYVGE